MQVVVETAKLARMQEEIDTLRQEAQQYRAQFQQRDLALRQTQQMLLTVVFAQPGHSVSLKEADFEALPTRPRMWQQTGEDGTIHLSVRDADTDNADQQEPT